MIRILIFLIIIMSSFAINSSNVENFEDWNEKNKWFGENEEMTNHALEFQLELLNEDIEIYSSEYFKLLDEEILLKFPEYFSNNPKHEENENINYNDDINQNELYNLYVEGNNLILEGLIETGLYEEFKIILKENININKLILKSKGGLVDEAFNIADLIIDYNIDTHAFNCYSMCATILLAGNKRTLQKGYKIGFHRSYWQADDIKDYYQYYIDNYEDEYDFMSWLVDDTQEDVFRQLQFLLERGVDPLFAIKTLRAKSDGMWYPRRSELLNSNFINE